MVHDLLRSLDRVPECMAILLRHAERGHISNPATSADVPITAKGHSDAKSLGRHLAGAGPLALHHSPIGRCRQTAEALSAGALEAGSQATLLGEDGRLGGSYLLNVPKALKLAGTLGHRFVREWFDGRLPSTFLKTRRATALEQVSTVEGHMNRMGHGRLLLVTHDWNLLAVREEFFGLRHEEDRWPGFLDGLVFWKEGGHLRVTAGPHQTVLLASQDGNSPNLTS